MAVVIETTLGDITVDLFVDSRPQSCLNFIKLCKMKYYNFNLFHSIQSGFIAQTGDPTGEGSGGESIWGLLHGKEKRYFSSEKMPKIRHTNAGLLSMVCTGESMVGSQFFLTLAHDLDSLDAIHCVIGEVTEGHDVLRKLNEVICDENHRPYRDVRITHTVILEDPFNDPPGLREPSRSPSPSAERLARGRIAPDEEIDESKGKSLEEIREMVAEREAKARATILEIVGDLPDAEIAPPENVLFVCKLNQVTSDEDLEIIFSRFGKIVNCEVIRDKKTDASLQYAFIEFADKKSCEDAYFKMDNVLIDDRRIHVDFSQSVSKVKYLGKGRIKHFNDNESEKVERPRKRSRSRDKDRNRIKKDHTESNFSRSIADRHRRKRSRSRSNHRNQQPIGTSHRERQHNEKSHKDRPHNEISHKERHTYKEKSNKERSHKETIQNEKSHRERDQKEVQDKKHRTHSSRYEETKEKSSKKEDSKRHSPNRNDRDRSRKDSNRDQHAFDRDTSHKDSEIQNYHRDRKELGDKPVGPQNNESIHKTKYKKTHKEENNSNVYDEKNNSNKKRRLSNEEDFSLEKDAQQKHYNDKSRDVSNKRKEENRKESKRMDNKKSNKSHTNGKNNELLEKRDTPDLNGRINETNEIETPLKENKSRKGSKVQIKRKKPGENKKKNKVVKRKRRRSSSSESSSSSSSTSTSESSSSSESDHKRKRKRKGRRKRSPSSTSSSTSSSSSSSSGSSSDSSSSSSSDNRHHKKKRKVVKKKRYLNKKR